MGHVLEASGSLADAYVQKDFAAQTDIYITVDLLIPAAHEAAIVGSEGYGPNFHELLHLGSSDQGLMTNPDGTDVGLALTYQSPFVTFGAPLLADTFYTIEMRVQAGSPITTSVWIDGVAQTFGGSGGHNQTNFDALRLGILYTNVDPDQVYYLDNLKIGTTRGGSEIFSEDFEGATPLDNFDSQSGAVAVIEYPPAPPPVLTPPSYEWRFAVAKLNGRVLSYLDKLARDKRIVYALNKSAVASGTVPSDNLGVYLVQSDGFPLLEEGLRVLLGFRREGGTPPWKIRYAGVILGIEDNVDENAGAAPYTNFTAYDPRQLLYKRPVRKADGSFPGPNGVTFTGQTGDEIALELLQRTIDTDGDVYIDVAGGTIETTDVISKKTFQQGVSVGEAWDQLAEDGNLDIILSAVYDPLVRPGVLADLNIYELAGTVRRKAVMAWDMPGRSLTGVNRLKDGDQRANKIRYHAGQGGAASGTVSDFGSVTDYGEYWSEQFFPGELPAGVELLADEQLLLRARGVTTYKVNPVPGSLGQISAPLVFLDYFLGDQVPIYGSGRLRQAVNTIQRVYEIPIDIRDDGVETINQLSFSDNGESGT